MEDIKNYIEQARLQGQNDDQIRQTLLATGWQAELVEAGFNSAVTPAQAFSRVVPVAAPSQPQPLQPQQLPANKSKNRPLILVLVIVIVIAVVAVILTVGLKKTSYQSIAGQFVGAMQSKDKTKADSLESPAFQAVVKKITPSDSSFYAFCQSEKALCAPYFENSFLSKATVTYKDYTAVNGIKGKEVTYTRKETTNNPKCPSNASTTIYLSIDLVPNGRSWLVDNVNPGSSTSGSINLCLTQSGTSSVGGQ